MDNSAQHEQYEKATVATSSNLQTIAASVGIREVSKLTLPEIEVISNLVARVVPAGNVPGVILSGLARLSGKKVPRDKMQRDIDLLFRGVEQVLNHAVYSAFFAGPAAVIWGYQHLLQLAGQSPDTSFPEGTWQFYVNYALREDTARHTNETHGFDTLLNTHGIRLTAVDRMTAWCMAAIQMLGQYHSLLENEWRERIYIWHLVDLTGGIDNSPFNRLYRKWERERPYARGKDATAVENYAVYRRKKFDRFMTGQTDNLDEQTRHQWFERIAEAEVTALPAYIQQMSILSHLESGQYGETRMPVDKENLGLCIVRNGMYFIIPVYEPGTGQLAAIENVRAQIIEIFRQAPNFTPIPLQPLVRLQRAAFADVRSQLPEQIQGELDYLSNCPIIINTDQRPFGQTLASIRQTERGIGDHALTLFDTGKTIAFDQSHIYFDGAWGAAFAEMMTGEALAWAVYLNATPSDRRTTQDVIMLQLDSLDSQVLTNGLPVVTPEVSAENEKINIRSILALRKVFKQRSDLIQLTVNDILILFRAIHSLTYQPAGNLTDQLRVLKNDPQTAKQATLTLQQIQKQANPAILIPVDASQRSPRDRLYPMCFEVPVHDLDLITLHAKTLQALNDYEQNTGQMRKEAGDSFDQLQREYLATLSGFGILLSKAKDIALVGDSSSVGAIKLLAHLPIPLQRLLEVVPDKFDILNDIIKGREVFSNVGAVASTSTLTRFITAKDDNEKKTLAWGVITDANGIMRVSLRDFRPHVRALLEIGQQSLAEALAHDYLESYVDGLNEYIRVLRRITMASRETRLLKLDEVIDE